PSLEDLDWRAAATGSVDTVCSRLSGESDADRGATDAVAGQQVQSQHCSSGVQDHANSVGIVDRAIVEVGQWSSAHCGFFAIFRYFGFFLLSSGISAPVVVVAVVTNGRTCIVDSIRSHGSCEGSCSES
ncbi:hypothetical protein PMAYCL1PPCAC_03862, partial [Pristionchus mayeri]